MAEVKNLRLSRDKHLKNKAEKFVVDSDNLDPVTTASPHPDHAILQYEKARQILKDQEEIRWIKEEMGLSNSVDVSAYDHNPLPFRSVNGENTEQLSWKDFDQDPDGKSIYLYRGIQNTDRKLASALNKSSAASLNIRQEQIFATHGTNDVFQICQKATESFQSNDPILHTTRRKSIAQGFASNVETGVVAVYKIPKQWLLEHPPVLGNIGEQEIDIFYELPPEFLLEVEQYGPDIETVSWREEHQSGPDESVINVDNLPPPPDVSQTPHL